MIAWRSFALLALAMAAGGLPSAAAQSGDPPSPWCIGIQSSEQGQSIACVFATFEACRDEAVMNRGWCFPNPRYKAVAPPAATEPPPGPRR